MTIVGVFGILLGLLGIKFAFIQRTRTRMTVFVLLFLAQVGTGFFYYVFAQTNTTDSPLYYYDEYGFYGQGFALNTGFVIYLVQTMKYLFGGTYLDYFLVFQGFGFWATVFMMRIFEEASLELGVEQPKWTYLLLFLPSLHFWTASIGKDGPLVFASAMAVWAAMRIWKRLIVFGLAILVMLLFRPHIALVAMGAASMAALVDTKSRASVRIVLLTAALLATWVLSSTVQSTFSVDVTSAESLSDFFATQSDSVQTMITDSEVISASYPVNLVSLLFRPFFFDSEGLLGSIASLENVLMVIMVGTILVRFGDSWKLARSVFFLRFAIIYTAVLVLLLAYVYYNVGLGLRQRSMFLPPLMSFFVVLLYLKPARRQVPVESYA